MDEIKIEVLDITPELAEEWLKYNTHNRPLRQNFVEQLAGAIRRGEWQMNAETMKFDREGVMFDGQHRLKAIVVAKRTVPAVVVYGLEPDAQDTVDVGRRRTLSDVLHLRNEHSPIELAAALNLLHITELGESALRSASANRPTVQQSLKRLDADPRIRETVRKTAGLRRHFAGVIPGSIVAVCWHRFTEINPDDCYEFWRIVYSGEELKRTDPRFALRRIIYANAQKNARVQTITIHAWVIKAWNAYRQGKEVDEIRWRAGGSAPEKFPEPV